MNYLSRLILLLLIGGYTVSLNAQESETEDSVYQDKLALGIGLGGEFSAIGGLNLNWSLNDQFSIFGTASPLLILNYTDVRGALPNIGLEYRLSKLVNLDRVIPYVFAKYGINNVVVMEEQVERVLIFREEEFINGLAIGGGARFYTKSKKLYFLAGIYWNVGNRNAIQNATEAFSRDNRLDYEFYYRDAFISIGLMYVFHNSDEEQ